MTARGLSGAEVRKLREKLDGALDGMLGQLGKGKGYSSVLQQHEARFKKLLYENSRVPPEIVTEYERRYEAEIVPRLEKITRG